MICCICAREGTEPGGIPFLDVRVQLFVEADDADAQQLAEQVPSSNSADHGAPFADIFARVNGDFYKIDGALFSPAEAIVTSVRTGATYRGGRLEPTLVEASFA